VPTANWADKIVDVIARVRINSPAIDLKNTPNELLKPKKIVPITSRVTTTTQAENGPSLGFESDVNYRFSQSN
jgi:hypothetical protein